MKTWRGNETAHTLSLHAIERRATIRAEHVALITVLCAVRAWHLSPDWMHRAARRLGKRA